MSMQMHKKNKPSLFIYFHEVRQQFNSVSAKWISVFRGRKQQLILSAKVSFVYINYTISLKIKVVMI